MAQDLATPSTVIPNAYRDRLFRILPGIARSRELVFLGRLVSDKGLDILLTALGYLRERGIRPRLTVVGDGPELQRLHAQATRLDLASHIEFLGWRSGEELVQLLNAHRILVLPSRYAEPFGIAALEGIASGCIVVGSAGGGLPSAIGPCGCTFPNGNARALAEILSDLLMHPELDHDFCRHAEEHLARHASNHILAQYVEVLLRVASKTRRRL